RHLRRRRWFPAKARISSVRPLTAYLPLQSSSKPYKVKPQERPGYIYLFAEDGMPQAGDLLSPSPSLTYACPPGPVPFCWRERSVPADQPELDLVMVPEDGHFVPYEYKTSDQPTSKTSGRIFVLKFDSSSARHLFWLQAKSQSRTGDASWFSPRDLKIG